eukprot:2943817-Pleurochrysis_carterae.AAC.1
MKSTKVIGKQDAHLQHAIRNQPCFYSHQCAGKQALQPRSVTAASQARASVPKAWLDEQGQVRVR